MPDLRLAAAGRGGGFRRLAAPAAWFAAALALVFFTGCRSVGPGQEAGGPVSAGVFTCEVTPPIGHPLCGGWIRPLETVDDPLLAKGIVLAHGRDRYVLCAVDWCLLQTGAHEEFVRKLAAAADVPVTHVALHTVHQHNAPIADLNAQELLDATPSPPQHLDLEFFAEVTDRVAAAVGAAARRRQPITHVGFGRARVERFASNRRVRLEDGQIHPRYSATQDPDLRAAAEGLIDPWLRTVTLFNRSQPVVRLHYYASHPMSYYGDGRATADTVGIARERLEIEEAVPQIYFTGCAGNITAGKYNDGSPAARQELTDRLHAAMRQAVDDTRRVRLRSLEWRTVPVRLVPRVEPEWSEAAAREQIAATGAPPLDRLRAALNLAWIERWNRDPDLHISALEIGPVTLLHLPAETFVEFQLHAQSLQPRRFIAVAAYGEGGPGYICGDADFEAGGYEPTMARVGPPSELRLKAAIARVLGVP